MSAYSSLITLTKVTPLPAGTIRLAAGQLISVFTSGSGASVYYNSNTAGIQNMIVSETPAAIATASQMLISLTITGGTIWVNPNRIILVSLDPVSGTGSVVTYFNPFATSIVNYVATETPAAIQTAISAIVGSGGGSVTTGLVAFAGGGQASATQLSFGYNEVITVATAGDSVKLQPAQAGAVTTVLNDGANAMNVFPATGDTINDGAANSPISLAPGNLMVFTAINSTNWETSTQTISTTSIKTGTISELIADSGTTFQNKLIFSDLQKYSQALGVTAFAGGGQASATQLTKTFNEVATVATDGDSVKLTALDLAPPAATGNYQIVKNTSAKNLAVYPFSGDSIDGLATDAPIVMAPNTTRIFFSPAATVWMSDVQSTQFTSTTTITAFATGGQASAVQLKNYFNNITVCATAGDSVKLLAASEGLVQVVKNNGATAADVFPNTGDTINGGAADAAIRLAVGETIVFYSVDGTDWQASFAGAGTVGNPSLPVGTKNKGFYEVSANQLGVSVNGALASMFDTSGFMSDSVRNRVNLGTTPVGTVSIVEYSNGKDTTAVLTLTNFIIGALAGAAANLGIGNIVYSFPAGQHLELVYSLSSLVLTAAGTAVATDTGLGSVVASGVVAVLSGTATFEDRLTGQTINTDPGGGAAVSALTAATAGIGTGISLNVAASVKDVFLNSAGTWNVDNVGDLTATGVIVLKWIRME